MDLEPNDRMPEAAHLVTEVQDALRGKECWYVSCGGSVGTTFQLALGKKIPRSVVVPNLAHSEEFRMYEGEANLLVWCTWRMDSIERPLTSSDDTIEHVEKVLDMLIGREIVNVKVDLPGWDLHLAFSGGLTLHVFCDHFPGEPSFADNWYLSAGNKMIAVGLGCECTVERRDFGPR